MITLNGVNDRIVAVVQIAQATNPVSIVTGWRVVGLVKHIPNGAGFNIADSNPVIIVPAPILGEQHLAEYISVSNDDTIAHPVNLFWVSGANSYRLKSITLGAGESMEYNGREFKVMSSNGAEKMIYQNGVSPIGTNVNMVVVPNGPGVVNNNAIANTMQDITGLQFAGIAGQKYWFKLMCDYSAALATTGSRWSINGESAPTELTYDSDYALTVTTRTINPSLNAYDLPAAVNATTPSLTGNIAIVEGFIRPAANGLIKGRFASEVAGSAITVKPGSFLQWQQLT